MISRRDGVGSAMSVPDVEPEPARRPRPAVAVRRGSTTKSARAAVHRREHVVEEDRVGLTGVRAPEDDDVGRPRPLDSELVPPPAPKTVARPTTLGACQVRLQESMLLVPTATRTNFWAR